MGKKLYRPIYDRRISGVCSGIAAYFNIDSTIVRLIWVILSFSTAMFPGILLYLVCVIIIPEEPTIIDGDYKEKY